MKITSTQIDHLGLAVAVDSLLADYNAALNIRARVTVNMPIAARLFAEPQALVFIRG